jgi:hypothetical protein
MHSAKRKEAMLAISISLPPHTLNLRPMFETIHEAVAHIFGEQVEEICLADSGGPGLGSVRQFLWSQLASSHNGPLRAMKASAFLQMFAVVIDREPELA